jgi:tripartite-type tricarboxylate transporter receptor subunit TctC
MISDTTGAMQHIQAGTIRVLAAAAAQRSNLLPDVGPAGVSAEIQNRLASAVAEVLAEPDAMRRMREIGSTPRSMRPAEFAGYVAQDIDRLTEVVQAANIKVD